MLDRDDIHLDTRRVAAVIIRHLRYRRASRTIDAPLARAIEAWVGNLLPGNFLIFPDSHFYNKKITDRHSNDFIDVNVKRKYYRLNIARKKNINIRCRKYCNSNAGLLAYKNILTNLNLETPNLRNIDLPAISTKIFVAKYPTFDKGDEGRSRKPKKDQTAADEVGKASPGDEADAAHLAEEGARIQSAPSAGASPGKYKMLFAVYVYLPLIFADLYHPTLAHVAADKEYCGAVQIMLETLVKDVMNGCDFVEYKDNRVLTEIGFFFEEEDARHNDKFITAMARLWGVGVLFKSLISRHDEYNGRWKAKKTNNFLDVRACIHTYFYIDDYVGQRDNIREIVYSSKLYKKGTTVVVTEEAFRGGISIGLWNADDLDKHKTLTIFGRKVSMRKPNKVNTWEQNKFKTRKQKK